MRKVFEEELIEIFGSAETYKAQVKDILERRTEDLINYHGDKDNAYMVESLELKAQDKKEVLTLVIHVFVIPKQGLGVEVIEAVMSNNATEAMDYLLDMYNKAKKSGVGVSAIKKD